MRINSLNKSNDDFLGVGGSSRVFATGAAILKPEDKFYTKMGIPSYFRRIIEKYSGILKKDAPKATYLCFDFNCLIYRCIRAPGMPKSEETEEFETMLLREVCKTVKEVWRAAGKPKNVLLAVDGVVPMAKIRQQRVRRFKSAWLRGNSSSWDTNSITPGTKFMDRLSVELKKILGNGWVLSGVDEAGEGEQKIMEWIKKRCIGESIIIYGLDGDLILLSMIASSDKKISLMREKQEFGGGISEPLPGEEQQYTFMDIEEFKIRVGVCAEDVMNYVGLMTLMGNDFLPHSLTQKLNDDGHDCVIREFKKMKKTGEWLIVDGKIQRGVLGRICKTWALDEDDRILHTFEKKRKQAERGIMKGMDVSEGLPLEWNVERVMMNGGKLIDGWREEYWAFIHPFSDRDRLCAEYVYGCQWVIDYYVQKSVNKSWIFPAWIPPLWSDLGRWLSCENMKEVEPAIEPEPTPSEQLAMVLPLKSWGLVSKEYSILPILAPQMWPQEFTFFSLGRRWLWECEARIPILTAGRVREILRGRRVDGEHVQHS